MLRDESDATRGNVTHKSADSHRLRALRFHLEGFAALDRLTVKENRILAVRRALRAFCEGEVIPIKDQVNRITSGVTFIGQILVSLTTGSFIFPEGKPSEHKDIHDGRIAVELATVHKGVPLFLCQAEVFQSFNIHNIYLL